MNKTKPRAATGQRKNQRRGLPITMVRYTLRIEIFKIRMSMRSYYILFLREDKTSIRRSKRKRKTRRKRKTNPKSKVSTLSLIQAKFKICRRSIPKSKRRKSRRKRKTRRRRKTSPWTPSIIPSSTPPILTTKARVSTSLSCPNNKNYPNLLSLSSTRGIAQHSALILSQQWRGSPMKLKPKRRKRRKKRKTRKKRKK